MKWNKEPTPARSIKYGVLSCAMAMKYVKNDLLFKTSAV
jgi:hypothetical protein